MKLLDRLMIVTMVLGVYALSTAYTYNVSKRLTHVESVTFGGDRCPKK